MDSGYLSREFVLFHYSSLCRIKQTRPDLSQFPISHESEHSTLFAMELGRHIKSTAANQNVSHLHRKEKPTVPSQRQKADRKKVINDRFMATNWEQSIMRPQPKTRYNGTPFFYVSWLWWNVIWSCSFYIALLSQVLWWKTGIYPWLWAHSRLHIESSKDTEIQHDFVFDWVMQTPDSIQHTENMRRKSIIEKCEHNTNTELWRFVAVWCCELWLSSNQSVWNLHKRCTYTKKYE